MRLALAGDAREREHVIARVPLDGQRLVVAVRSERRRAPRAACAACVVVTNILSRSSSGCSSSSAATSRGRPARGSAQLAEQRAALRVVDGPAVVRIDQAEIPELGALIEIGHAGRGDLDQRAARASCRCRARDARVEARGNRRRNAALLGESTISTKRVIACSYASLGFSQLVWTFASRSAFDM